MTANPSRITPTGTPQPIVATVGATTGTAVSAAISDGAPAPGGTPKAVVDPAWLRLSAAMTDEVAPIADREDLLVSIAPGLGQGSPACFVPKLARIEIDGAHLAVDPATAQPHRGAGDRTRYDVAWGLLVHECAHACHSEWVPPLDAPPGAVAAATLLEEARIEAAQVRRRPDDRHWLRAAATRLILADLTPAPAPPANHPNPTAHPSPPPSTPTSSPSGSVDPGADPGRSATATAPALSPRIPAAPVAVPVPPPGPATARSRADAAHTAALVLARADGGIFTPAEVAPVAAAVQAELGVALLGRLRTLWRDALTVADDDPDAMIELGRRWCDEIGLDPSQPARSAHTRPDPHPTATVQLGTATPPPTGAAAQEHPPTTNTVPDALTAALAQTCRAVEIEVLLSAPSPDPRHEEHEQAEQQARDRADQVGNTILRSDMIELSTKGRSHRTALAGTRAPSDRERSAARVLGRALDTAGTPNRVPTRTGSVLPPGRLRMRGARAADAQRAAGAIPTAEAFVKTTRRCVPDPPLRLGVICDVSGSMSEFAGPVASTAWILAHAAHHTRVPVSTATVIFGANVRLISRPGVVPATVTEFEAQDGAHAAHVAIDAVDGILGLARPGAARLLVIISDGHWGTRERRPAQNRVERLITSGCGVLWLAPSATGLGIAPLPGATVSRLTDPTDTARAIGRAATTALRATH